MNGYDEQTWVNGESQANAQRFNHMEAGIKNAYNVSLIAITNIEPSECNEGDKYFNTTDNLIYTATDTDTWGETGETPISDKTYVLITDGSTYAYNGTTLTRIGGSEQIVANEYSESTTIPYSANYVNGAIKEVYSTSEIEIGVWIDGSKLYRKVIDFGALPDSTSKSVAHNITNLDTIVSLIVFANSIQGGGIPIPHATTTTPAYVYVSTTSVTIATTNDRTPYTNTYVTIVYTKTTD
jgi:hypothetical protein